MESGIKVSAFSLLTLSNFLVQRRIIICFYRKYARSLKVGTDMYIISQGILNNIFSISLNN